MGTRRFEQRPTPERFGQLPLGAGVVFICENCRRPTATSRDAVLKAWGERGVIADVAAKLKCRWCKKRGMRAVLAPYWANLGSPRPLDRFVADVMALTPSGEVH